MSKSYDPFDDELELAEAIVKVLGSFDFRNVTTESKACAIGGALAMWLEQEEATEETARDRILDAFRNAKQVWFVRHPIREEDAWR